MCGRARASAAAAAVARAAGVSEAAWRDRERYTPRYNAGPGSWLPVLRTAAPAGDDDAATDAPDAPRERQLQSMRWGLVPSFTRKEEAPNFFRAFNARSDTLCEKPLFSRLLARKRAVVLLHGFYEWREEGAKAAGLVKQPYYLHADGAPDADDAPQALLRAAALYDRWQGADGAPLYTVTILTTDAAPELRWLHDRMPVFLRDEAAEGASAEKVLREVSRPGAGPPLTWHAVSTAINKGELEGPQCCAPAKRAAERDAGSVAALFARKAAAGVAHDAADAAAEGEAWAAEGSAHAPQLPAEQGHVDAAAERAAAPQQRHTPPPKRRAEGEAAPPSPSPPQSAQKRAKAATPPPKGQPSVASFFRKAEPS